MARKNKQPKQQPVDPIVEAPVVEPATTVAVLPRRSIVPAGYRESCHKDKEHRTAAGNISVDVNDALAQFLRGRSVQDVAKIAAVALGVEESALLAKYAHLNVGQQRMNIGNRLRAAVKDGLWAVPAVKA